MRAERFRIRREVIVTSGINADTFPDIFIVKKWIHVIDGCPPVKFGLLLDWVMKYVLHYTLNHDWRDQRRARKVIKAFGRASSIGFLYANQSYFLGIQPFWSGLDSMFEVSSNLIPILGIKCVHVKSLYVKVCGRERYHWWEDKGLEKLRLSWQWNYHDLDIYRDAQFLLN